MKVKRDLTNKAGGLLSVVKAAPISQQAVRSGCARKSCSPCARAAGKYPESRFAANGVVPAAQVLRAVGFEGPWSVLEFPRPRGTIPFSNIEALKRRPDLRKTHRCRPCRRTPRHIEHHFNNLLTAVLSNLAVAVLQVPNESTRLLLS